MTPTTPADREAVLAPNALPDWYVQRMDIRQAVAQEVAMTVPQGDADHCAHCLSWIGGPMMCCDGYWLKDRKLITKREAVTERMLRVFGQFHPQPAASGVVTEVAERLSRAIDMSDDTNPVQLRELIGVLLALRTEPLPVGVAGVMPGTTGFTMACFRAADVPAGTNLFATQPPALAQPQPDYVEEVGADGRPTGYLLSGEAAKRQYEAMEAAPPTPSEQPAVVASAEGGEADWSDSAWTCPRCGQRNSAGYATCGRCEHQVASGVASTTPPDSSDQAMGDARAWRFPVFSEAWKVKEAEGFQWGRDALASAKVGYELAIEMHTAQPPTPPADAVRAREDGWLPIESAPKDGTAVLMFFPKRYQSTGGISWACWVNGEWLDSRAMRDNGGTHWRPMPAPPAALESLNTTSGGGDGK